MMKRLMNVLKTPFNIYHQLFKSWWRDEKALFKTNASIQQMNRQIQDHSHKLCEYLPYDQFDPETGLFFNKDSAGFVLETPSLCGASDAMQTEMDGFFRYVLPEGSSLQTLLWADPNLDAACTQWKSSRKGTLHQALAQRSVDHFKAMAFESPQAPFHIRNFRCLISYTQPMPNIELEWQKLYDLQKQLMTTLEGIQLPVTLIGANALLNTVQGILRMEPNKAPSPLQWNPLESLSEQLRSIPVKVEKDHVLLSNELIQARNYFVQKMPQAWSLHSMGELIGDAFRDQAQIPCPFLLHYGVYIPTQAGPKRKLITKAANADRQSRSPIGRFLPGMTAEAEQFNFARHAIGEGGRVVYTQLNVVLLASPTTLPAAEQALHNLYLSKGWVLEKTPYTALPELVSCLPMTWSTAWAWVDALRDLHQLRTTLSTEAANLQPLQAEWRGTHLPGLLLAGRRGQLINWPPFDEQAAQNYNVCVAGRPGTGKSVFMQELMTSVLGNGGYGFVLDIGRSFEKTCHLLNGTFIEFTTRYPVCLNLESFYTLS